MEFIFLGKKIVSRSKNLAGVRRYASQKAKAVKVMLHKNPDLSGKLSVRFDDGARFDTRFASYDVLCPWVYRWLSVYGARLFLQGKDVGILSGSNPHFQPPKIAPPKPLQKNPGET